MTTAMDDAIGAVATTIQGLQDRRVERTLIVFSADNGGPITQAANNWPLRGAKHSNFDGGVRVNAFVSGGYLPPAVRGTRSHSLVPHAK